MQLYDFNSNKFHEVSPLRDTHHHSHKHTHTYYITFIVKIINQFASIFRTNNPFKLMFPCIPPKTSENIWFSKVFRGYRKKILTEMNVLFYHFFQKGNAFSKSVTKTMVQVVKSVQRKHWKHEGEVKSVVLLSFLFTWNTLSSVDFDANFHFLEGLKLASTTLKIYGKCFLFHAKCSYRYQDN